MRELRIDRYREDPVTGRLTIEFTENREGTVLGLPASGDGIGIENWTEFKSKMDFAEQECSTEILVLLVLARIYRGDQSRNNMENAVGKIVTLDFAGPGQPIRVST